MTRKLFKEDIDKYRNSTGCIPKSANKYIDSTGNINFKKWKEKDINGYNKWKSEMKSCNEEFYKNSDGCCYNENSDDVCLTNDNKTGLTFLDENNKLGNLCHKDKIQNIYNTLFDDPDHIKKFLKLIIVSILSLLVTAIIGTCYEFWLRYGHSKECIYYKSKCGNIGKSNEISLIDYMFPNSICYYPYQICNENKNNQIGGSDKTSGIISNFSIYESTGAKCVTIDEPLKYNERPVPYNIADYADNKSEVIKVLAKTISFYFLFPVLIIRKILNIIFTIASKKFNITIKNNALLGNLAFLFLTGLIFPIIAYFTKINIFYSGPMMYISGLLSLVTTIMSFGFIATLVFTIIPQQFFGTELSKCGIQGSYYQIFTSKLFYRITDVSLRKAIENIIKNILLFFPILFIILISYILGAIMSSISVLYMNISLFFNIFYIPLSNPLECLNILKSHSDLLTILFCIGVIGSAAGSLDSTTTGIMSILLAIIIVYKLFKGMKTNI